MRSPLSFDYYGNASKPIDIDIISNKQLPYLFHAMSVNRHMDSPLPVEEGQFDSDEEVDEKVSSEVDEKVSSEVDEKVSSEVDEKVSSEVYEKVSSEVDEKVSSEEPTIS